MGSASARSIAKIIKRRKGEISHLCLRENSIKDVGLEALAKSIGESELIHLCIEQNGITAKGLNKLFKALQGNSHMVSLALGNRRYEGKNYVGAAAMPALVDYLQERSCMCQFLDLRGSNIRNKGLQILARGLKNNSMLYSLNL